MTIGDTIKEYRITEHLGQTELEDFYFAVHETLDIVAHVRALRQEWVSNSPVRSKYAGSLWREVHSDGLSQYLQFVIVDRGEYCLRLRHVESLATCQRTDGAWGQPESYGFAPVHPGKMARFAEHIELLEMCFLVVGALYFMLCALWAGAWAYREEVLAVIGAGVFTVVFLIATAAGVGMMKRKKWGLRAGKVTFFALFLLGLLLVTVLGVEDGRFLFGIANGEVGVLLLLGGPLLPLSLVGIALLYLPEAKYYFTW